MSGLIRHKFFTHYWFDKSARIIIRDPGSIYERQWVVADEKFADLYHEYSPRRFKIYLDYPLEIFVDEIETGSEIPTVESVKVVYSDNFSKRLSNRVKDLLEITALNESWHLLKSSSGISDDVVYVLEVGELYSLSEKRFIFLSQYPGSYINELHKYKIEYIIDCLNSASTSDEFIENMKIIRFPGFEICNTGDIYFPRTEFKFKIKVKKGNSFVTESNKLKDDNQSETQAVQTVRTLEETPIYRFMYFKDEPSIIYDVFTKRRISLYGFKTISIYNSLPVGDSFKLRVSKISEKLFISENGKGFILKETSMRYNSSLFEIDIVETNGKRWIEFESAKGYFLLEGKETSVLQMTKMKLKSFAKTLKDLKFEGKTRVIIESPVKPEMFLNVESGEIFPAYNILKPYAITTNKFIYAKLDPDSTTKAHSIVSLFSLYDLFEAKIIKSEEL